MDSDARQYVFVVSAVDRDGNRTSQKVTAASGRDALAAVEAEGYVDAELLSEESMSVGVEAIIDAEGVDVDEFFTPEEQIAFGKRSNWGNFVYSTGKMYRENLWKYAVVIAFLAFDWSYGPISGEGSRLIVILSVILFLIPPVLSAMANFMGSSVEFDRMLEAMSWGRYQEVLKIVPRLRGSLRDFELDAYEAQAYAGLGRMPEALERLERYREDPGIDEWYLCSKYAEVYETADDEVSLLETHRRAMQTSEPPAVVYLDAALAMLRTDQGLEEAGQLIERVSADPLGEPIGLVAHYVEGLLAHRRGNLRSALARYAEGREALAAYEQQPLVRSIRDEFLAREAIAHAEAGEKERALALWRQAEPRARAIGSKRLLREVEAALGVATG